MLLDLVLTSPIPDIFSPRRFLTGPPEPPSPSSTLSPSLFVIDLLLGSVAPFSVPSIVNSEDFAESDLRYRARVSLSM